ncbi:MAG: single-stranded DNA-binding protein [Cyanobacteria bacterium SIG30]|nr:single-stranded DNA-binding protein [Cyanobacteria bacterium SIG30]
MVNSVVIVGRAGQDPEMKYFESEKVKTTFSLAVNRWDNRTKEEVTDWFNIEVWDKQAEFAGEWIKKGRMVGVEGRLISNKWQGADGTMNERFIIRATNVRLIGGRKEE